MKKNKELILENNAGCFKRIFSFFMDSVFISILTTVIIKIFVLNKSRVEKINEVFAEFNNLFGKIRFGDIEDYHIRFIVNSQVFSSFLLYICVTIVVAVLYNFLMCYFFNATIGQKILSLKTVNINNNEKANPIKLFLKAILVQFPFKLTYLMIIGQILYLINFHKYAPINNVLTSILVNIVSISNLYVIGVVLFMFLLFWYDIYFITDKLILSDIISRTRVIEVKKVRNLESSSTSFTSVVDWVLDCLFKVNVSLKNTLKKWINYLK